MVGFIQGVIMRIQVDHKERKAINGMVRATPMKWWLIAYHQPERLSGIFFYCSSNITNNRVMVLWC
uniref:Transposase n=1 Tax=Heterorhabditis bacteriophora TaxID=37862 RepID=A0A1I7WJL3_HETBA